MLTIFWGIISFIFFTLVVLHSIWSTHKFSPLQFKGKVGEIKGLPLGIKEVTGDINDFVDRFNKHNKKMNIAQLLGYLAAFGAALASAIITIR